MSKLIAQAGALGALLLLNGCSVFDALVSGVAPAAQGPKIVYSLPDKRSTVEVAAITQAPAIFRLATFPTFDQNNNRVRQLRLSPGETYTAVFQTNDFDSVLEVFLTQDTSRKLFHTDNTLQSSVETLCTASSQVVAEAIAAWQADVAEAEGQGEPPPPRPETQLPDAPENGFEGIAWADDTSLLVRTRYAVNVPPYIFDFEIFQLTLQVDQTGEWHASGCATETTGPPPLPEVPQNPVRILGPGSRAGSPQPLTIDGAVATNSVGRIQFPGGVTAAHGGFR